MGKASRRKMERRKIIFGNDIAGGTEVRIDMNGENVKGYTFRLLELAEDMMPKQMTGVDFFEMLASFVLAKDVLKRDAREHGIIVRPEDEAELEGQNEIMLNSVNHPGQVNVN